MEPTTPEARASVLIIEDNEEYAERLLRAFQESERGLTFDTRLARSAADAFPIIDQNKTDIYVVDLELPASTEPPSEAVGEMLVKAIVGCTDGGTIIHTSSLRTDREDFLWSGVDDYIVKGDTISHVIAKSFAVWRRVQHARKLIKTPTKKGRVFRVGKWLFEAGNRILLDENRQKIRLSPTELIFLEYLCTIDAEIDRREFNVAVLGRPAHEEDMRIDNLIYRMREKLGGTFQIVARRPEGIYKLLDFEEVSDRHR